MDKDPEMTTRVDREIMVALLLGGADTPTNLSEITNRHVQSVYERLKQLSEEKLIWNKGNGVYQLTEDGTVMARAILREYSIAEDLDLREPQ